MENTSEVQDICTDFEHTVEENIDVADAIYYGRMVAFCERVLDSIDGDIQMSEKSDWDEFLEYKDVDELRQLYGDSYEPEMHDGVNEVLMAGTSVFVRKAKDVDELKRMLSEEWDPVSEELLALRAKYKGKCESLCEQIAAKIEAHYQ